MKAAAQAAGLPGSNRARRRGAAATGQSPPPSPKLDVTGTPPEEALTQEPQLVGWPRSVKQVY
eukprot:216679-Chlamydomonas_euryale.AAC.1